MFGETILFNQSWRLIMKQTLRVLLVTALVAPLFFLTACCNTCDTKCEDKCTYDKMGTKYDNCNPCRDGVPAK